MNFIKTFYASITGSRNGEVSDTSPAGSLNKIDVAKVLRDALILGFVATLTHLVESPEIRSEWGATTVMGGALLLQILNKFAKSNKHDEDF